MRLRRIRRAYLWTALIDSAALAVLAALAATGPIFAIKVIGYVVGTVAVVAGIVSAGWMLAQGRPRR